ncbi:hypothetical protein MMC16_004917 [Acarospora aff. strigata]|nr:hypothetical protein [Acarospora aff. strigata]
MSRDSMGSEVEGSLFEFLYPAHTLAFIRRLSSYSLQKRWRKQRTKNGIRLFTSRATEPEDEVRPDTEVSADVFSAEHDEADQKPQDQAIETEPFLTLDDLLQSRKRKSYDSAWRLFQSLAQTEEEATLTYYTEALLQYLSTSARSVDAERIAELFSRLPTQQRETRQYRIVIEAYLKLPDLEKAVEAHKEALMMVAGDVGTATLLASAVECERWELGSCALHDYRRRLYVPVGKQAIWDEVDNIPHLMERALSLAAFAENAMAADQDASQPESAEGFGEFVNAIMIRALEFKSEGLNGDNVRQYFEKLKLFGLLTKDRYEDAMHKLLSLGLGSLAGSVYRKHRGQDDFMPSQKLLYRLLDHYCRFNSVSNIQIILEDLFAVYGGLDRAGYRAVIGKLAGLGDANSVHKLFADSVSRYGAPSQVSLLRPLLLVHSRRAEVDETVRQFRRLSEEFGLTPDLQCWNILISAYSRITDVDGAFRCFNELLGTSFKPDRYTFGIMFNLCARKGDTTMLQELFRLADDAGIQTSVAAIDSLVLSCINNDELDEAERIAEAALSKEIEGSRTRMWNYLLNAHSLRGNIDDVTRIHHRMQDAGVPLDSMTYATLMQSLTVLKETDAAYKILRVVMPRDGIRVTAFHYAIVMGGYVRTNETVKVFRVYKRMLERRVRPTLSTQIPLLKAGASVEADESLQQAIDVATQKFSQTDDLLEETLANLDPMELASKEPVRGNSKEPLDSAYLAAPFDFLIFIYGQQGLFDKVQQLYEKYIKSTEERKLNRTFMPTIKLLSALMVSYFRQQQHDDVYKCWELARSCSARLSKRFGAGDLSEPGWVLPSQRYLLATPLMYLMKTLGEQEDLDGITQIITELQSDGYELDSKNWNLYIQLLIRNGRILEAFQYCEEKLINGWMGWPFQRQQQGLSKAVTVVNKVQPWKLSPNYQTYVHLASAVMDMQTAESGNLSSLGRGAGSERLTEAAPRTMEAVRNMPRIDDNLQTDLLRRW